MSSQNNNICGNTIVFLEGSTEVIRTEETNLGNLVADAILSAAKSFDDSVILSITRGGNFFSSIEVGEISQSDIETTLSLNSTLTLATVTAQELRYLLEFGVANTAEGETPSRFPQIGGFRFSFAPDETAIELDEAGNIITEGQRIRNAAILDEAGKIVDIVVRDGEVVGESDRPIRLVAPQSLIEPLNNNLDPELVFPIENPVINFIEDRGFVLQNLNPTTEELVPFFELDIQGDFTIGNGTLKITDVDLLVSSELSNLLVGGENLTGTDIGDAQIDGLTSANGINLVIDGGTTSVNLDLNLLANLGIELSNTIATTTPAQGFAVGFPIVSEADDNPFIFNPGNGFTPLEGVINHQGRVVFTENTNPNNISDEVFFSVDNPIINFITDRGFVLQDFNLTTNDVITLFDLDIQGAVNVGNDNLSITGVNLLVSPELSTLLVGNNTLVGTDVGDAQLDGLITPNGDNFAVNGGVTSVNLDLPLLETVGLNLANAIATTTPTAGFAVGFSIASEDDTPFIFSTDNGLTPISGNIDHLGRAVFAANENPNNLPPEVFFSVDNPIISLVENRGFVLQDFDLTTNELIPLFEIAIGGDTNDVSFDDGILRIIDAELLISPELSILLNGTENFAGIDIGDARIDASTTPNGDNFLVTGGVTSINLEFNLLESIGLSFANAIGTETPAQGFAAGFSITGEGNDLFTFNDFSEFTPIAGDIDHEGTVILETDTFAPTLDVYPFNFFAEDIVDLQDALQISVDNPIIDFIAGRGFVLQDTNFGSEDIFTLFDLDIQGGVNVDNNTLSITNVNLLVSPEFASALGNSALAGTDLGDAQVDGSLTPDGNNFSINGGTTSVNLDFALLETLGLSLFRVTGTDTPAESFAVGFPIAGEADENPFVFSTENGLTPISGNINHNGRVVLEASGNANFAGEGSEQDALAEYLSESFGSRENAFNEVETSPEEDTRIQNLNFREDTVLGSSDNLLTTEIFRFRTGNGTYLYVAEAERQTILSNGFGFIDEGKAFNVSFEENNNLVPIYRFRNDNLAGGYLYVGEAERQNIISSDFNFTEEGLAFYTYGADAQQEDDIFRFQTIPGGYIFVTEAERQTILNSGLGFVEEGIAFEALV